MKPVSVVRVMTLVTVIRVLYFSLCAAAIASFLRPAASLPGIKQLPAEIEAHPFLAFLLLLALSQLPMVIDMTYRRKRIDSISAIYFGLLIAYLISQLLIQAVQPMFDRLRIVQYYHDLFETLITLGVYFLSVTLLLQTKDDFRFVIPYVQFARELKGRAAWILDSSALIDGRIADIVEANIVDAPMIVPQFVLHEVQDIADSNDKMRRTRGRRGLEVLSKLQSNPKADIKMHETKKDEFKGMSVDQRLVEVAKQLGGHVVTNDFNLNKVASVQGIEVINLNDLANALKPRYLPGEHVRIKILKEGESQGQGIGYLDDGTMVVCEQTSHLVGKDLDIIVTSVLQSSAGRMIFGRQVHAVNKSN